MNEAGALPVYSHLLPPPQRAQEVAGSPWASPGISSGPIGRFTELGNGRGPRVATPAHCTRTTSPGVVVNAWCPHPNPTHTFLTSCGPAPRTHCQREPLTASPPPPGHDDRAQACLHHGHHQHHGTWHTAGAQAVFAGGGRPSLSARPRPMSSAWAHMPAPDPSVPLMHTPRDSGVDLTPTRETWNEFLPPSFSLT